MKRAGSATFLLAGLVVLITAAEMLLFPVLKCPNCRPLLEEVEVEMSRNPTPEMAEYQQYAIADMPCHVCDQRRCVRFTVWYKAKHHP